MDENLHKDNLEEFFKNSFNNENIEPSDDQWDIPSDSVWDGINEKINPVPLVPATPAAAFFYLKWFFAAAASVLIIGLVYYNYTLRQEVALLRNLVEVQQNTINELKLKEEKKGRGKEEKIGSNDEPSERNSINGESEVSNSDFESLSSAFSDKPSQPQVFKRDLIQDNLKNNSSAQQKEGQSFKPVEHNGQPTENTNNSKKAIANGNFNSEEPGINIIFGDNLVNNGQPKDILTGKQNLKNTSSTQSVAESNYTVALMPLPAKVTLAEVDGSFQKIALPPLPISENSLAQPESPLFKPGFYIGAHISPTYSYRNIKSINGPVLRRLLNEKENAIYSAALGIKAGYQFSKNWSVETGLNYYKNSVESIHRAQIRYESQIERLNGDGDYDSNYLLKLSTSYGDIETDVALTRKASAQIDQNDYINLVLKTRQELKYLGVPIAIRYRTAGNKFHFSAKAGISGNFILQKDVTIKAAMVNRSGVRQRRVIVDRKFEGLENTTFDFLLGIGADYDVSKNLSVYFEPTFTHSISPVYNLHGKIKTYPIVASMNIGLMYRF